MAVLSAAATSAGALTTSSGAADAFSRGFIGAAVTGVAVVIVALVRMPATRATGGAGSLHMH